MKYKVFNLECDMKLVKNGRVITIKQGNSVSVTQKEYQYLAQIYGMAVKGTEDIVVRVTEPIRFEKSEPVIQAPKRRKNKKS